MATILEDIQQVEAEANDIIDRGLKEHITAADESRLEELKQKHETLTKRYDNLNASRDLFKGIGTPQESAREQQGAPAAKSLGEHVATGLKDNGAIAAFKNRAQGTFAIAEFPRTGAKANTDVATTGVIGSASYLNIPDIDKTIVKPWQQAPVISDWLGSGNITGTSITYFVSKLWDKAANGKPATTRENSKVTQVSAPNYEQVNEALKAIAAFVKISNDMAEDFAFLVSEINDSLLFQLILVEAEQLLSGDGAGTNIKGLLNRTGIQTITAATPKDDKETNLDLLYKAKSAVFQKSGLHADGILMNPADYDKLRLAKDENGQYLAGGPFTGAYGNGTFMPEPGLWGLPTIQSNEVPAGTAIVGAGKQGATVYRKGSLTLNASNADSDDFTNRRFAVLAEERLTLAVRRPEAFVKVTLKA